MKRMNILIMISFSLMLAACEKSADKDVLQFVGKTYSLCSNEAVGSTYQAYHFIDETDLSWQVTTHTGQDCLEGNKIDTRHVTGKYQYDYDQKLWSELFLQEEVTLHDAGAVNAYNAIVESCGLSGGWVLDVPVDITGLEGCDGGDFLPDVDYYDRQDVRITKDIMKIDGIYLYP